MEENLPMEDEIEIDLKEIFFVLFSKAGIIILIGMICALSSMIYTKTLVKPTSLDLWPESLTMGGIQSMSPVYRFFLSVSKRIYRRADTVAVSSYGFREYFKNPLGIEKPVHYLPQYA